MQTLHTLAELHGRCPRPCVAIGVFDGVHVGHQAVIRQAIADARDRHGTAVVLTFDPHPQRVLQPDKAPPLLTATAHKLRLIAALGADATVVLKFDPAFAAQPPEQFIEQLCRNTDRLQTICVGARFHFGHHRAGNIRLIEALAARYGYTARAIAPVKVGDHLVSSTAISLPGMVTLPAPSPRSRLATTLSAPPPSGSTSGKATSTSWRPCSAAPTPLSAPSRAATNSAGNSVSRRRT